MSYGLPANESETGSHWCWDLDRTWLRAYGETFSNEFECPELKCEKFCEVKPCGADVCEENACVKFGVELTFAMTA